MAGMLEGVRVVEYTRLWEDRVGMVLADLGADVIKLEPKSGSPTRRWWGEVKPDWSPYHVVLNRNKQSFAIDLGQEEGIRLAARLAASADIFVRGYDPTDPTETAFSYETLKAQNNALVYCDLSPFGVYGQYEGVAGTLNLATAATGQWRVRGGENGQTEVREGMRSGAADGGALYAAYGVIAALRRRLRTGEGTYLDISQMDAQAVMHFPGMVAQVEGGRVHQQGQGTGGGGGSAKYNYYETKDGKFMLMAVIERQFWNRFVQAGGRPDLVDETEWDAPVDFGGGNMELRREIQSITLQKTLAEWVDLFREHRIAGGPGTPPEELAEDPHLQARGIIVETNHPVVGPFTMPGSPLVPLEIRRPAPALGEHTTALLTSLGESEATIGRLRQQGVIA